MATELLFFFCFFPHTVAVSGMSRFWEKSRLMALTSSICAGEIEFPEQRGACGEAVDCGRRRSLLFEGLPDRHSLEAPGRLVHGTDRLTSAVREGLWLTSAQVAHVVMRSQKKQQEHIRSRDTQWDVQTEERGQLAESLCSCGEVTVFT